MTFQANARVTCGFVIVMSLGCVSAAAHQDPHSPANSTTRRSAAAPPQAETQSPQHQDQIQNSDSAKSRSQTKTQPNLKPAKKQSANSAAPNTHSASPKRAAAPPSAAAPKKVVIREGGAPEPTEQIIAGITPEEAHRQRREAELLLSTTEEKLKEIAPRPLDAQQEETIAQIHSYMAGSRSALKQGDVSRAHTLALKAGLLADDLASR
ncbi:MAG: hypothetical protein WA609_05530 [Terriglobales bacterium]